MAPTRPLRRGLLVALFTAWTLACAGGGTGGDATPEAGDGPAPKDDGVALVEPWSEMDGLPPAGATVVSCNRGECVFEHGKTVTLPMVKPYARAMKGAGFKRMEEDPIHKVMPFIKHQQGGIIVNVAWGTRETTSTRVTLSFQ